MLLIVGLFDYELSITYGDYTSKVEGIRSVPSTTTTTGNVGGLG